MTVELTGVRETLKALKTLDPELRKQTVREIKGPGQIILDAAKAKVPSGPPMSGWRGGPRGKFPSWDSPVRGMKLKFGGRASASKAQWPLLELRQNDGAGVIYDMASKPGGSPQSVQFIANLVRAGGKASRTVWPAVDEHQAIVTASVRAAVAKAETLTNQRMR